MERILQDRDLPASLPHDSSAFALDYFHRLWHAEQQRHPHRPSLRRALARDFFSSVWFAQPLMCAAAAAKVTQAVVLGNLVEFFQGQNDRGYLWAGILVVCGLVLLFEHHHLFFFTWRKGMQIRVACIAAIYDKSLRLASLTSMTHTSVSSTPPSGSDGSTNRATTTTNDAATPASYGKVMNLASNDVERFLMAALFINYLFWAPLQSIAILIVGWWQMGPAFAAGFALLIGVFIPLQFYLGGTFAFYRSKIAGLTDRRVTFVSQAIRGARVMKMSGYEDRFLERIMEYRRDEIAQIAKANTLKSWNEALFFSTNVVISLVIFLVHVFTGNELNEGDVFTVFTLINILQLEMTKHVSLAVMATSECWVSIGRIQQFLEFPELVTDEHNDAESLAKRHETGDDEEANIAISLQKVNSYWNEVDKSIKGTAPRSTTATAADDLSESDASAALYPALQDVSVDFGMGSLTAIIGTVGSGKSALLQAIVKELPVSSGKIERRYKSLAYAAQDPWIMDGTVKENILMGLELDEPWYEQVITACGLVMDFQQLSHGDQTILGDRGVQCSGGQRARIGLARAIYRDTDVLVADDPLSAVDSRVGRQLYKEALQGLAVAKGKCVILATHQHQYVHDCRCVLVAEGRVRCIGSYHECVEASNGKLTAHAADDDAIDGLDYNEAGKKVDDTDKRIEHISDGAIGEAVAAEEDPELLLLSDGDKDHKEMNQVGNVEWETYANYLRAMGGIWIGGFLLFLFTGTQASVLVTIATVGRWAERPANEQDDWDIVGLVIGLGCLVVVLALFRAFISFHLTIQASQRLHDRMAKAVLRAKIQFFDTNPLGRILNRFSADVGITDDLLPPTLFDFFMLSFIVLGALVTTVSTLPFVLVALPFLGWYFLYVRNVFVTSSRELKRLEGLARSPIFAMLSESLGGIATIRANNALDFFRSKFQEAHDTHTRCFFSFIAASRWVGFRMDSLVFLFLAAVSFLSVTFNKQGWFSVDPAILGLSLSMLLQLTGLFQWCIRQSAEVVNQMVSVERVLDFGKVESEAPLELEGDRALLETGWPSQGAIQVEDLSVRYRDSLPLALKEISFSIPQGARVGVVGRTGESTVSASIFSLYQSRIAAVGTPDSLAYPSYCFLFLFLVAGSGKSTVVQTLFRLLEAEHGRIVIDGVDVSQLGLHALRTKISVIPQVPTLFSGCSIRENLDLFGLHSNEAIAKVLRDCHLQQMIDDLPNGLDSPVSEGGTNFSVGQRQLLCLARAILSQNKILILDEATASVDRRTDQLLQEALQESFRDGTILAVAHRLDTIIEYDFILVLGGGRVLEFGSPAELLRRDDGAFCSMVTDTGDAMAGELRQRARQAR